MKCIHTGIASTLLTLSALLLFFASVSVHGGCAPQQDDSQQASTAAEQVMTTLNDGLTGHSTREFLSAFDPDRMQDYGNFADQMRRFFALYDNIRVHYQIIDARSAPDKSITVTADIELEGDNANNDVPGVSRSGQLHLRLSRSKSGWKIADLQPREFFR